MWERKNLLVFAINIWYIYPRVEEVIASVGGVWLPGEGEDQGTEAQERYGGQEGSQGPQLETLGQEVGQEAGQYRQEAVVVGGPGEGAVQPGGGEVVDLKQTGPPRGWGLLRQQSYVIKNQLGHPQLAPRWFYMALRRL